MKLKAKEENPKNKKIHKIEDKDRDLMGAENKLKIEMRARTIVKKH